MLRYLDASISIDVSDPDSALYETILPAFRSLEPDEICISDLVRMECLIHPLRFQKEERLSTLQAFFSRTVVLPIEGAVFDIAARLRADRMSLKTPDALHLATALHHGCAEFWTGDRELARTPVNLTFRTF